MDSRGQFFWLFVQDLHRTQGHPFTHFSSSPFSLLDVDLESSWVGDSSRRLAGRESQIHREQASEWWSRSGAPFSFMLELNRPCNSALTIRCLHSLIRYFMSHLLHKQTMTFVTLSACCLVPSNRPCLFCIELCAAQLEGFLFR